MQGLTSNVRDNMPGGYYRVFTAKRMAIVAVTYADFMNCIIPWPPAR
jgi:hypothetical protein